MDMHGGESSAIVQLSAQLWSKALEASLQTSDVTIGGDDTPEAKAPLDLAPGDWMSARADEGDIDIRIQETEKRAGRSGSLCHHHADVSPPFHKLL